MPVDFYHNIIPMCLVNIIEIFLFLCKQDNINFDLPDVEFGQGVLLAHPSQIIYTKTRLMPWSHLCVKPPHMSNVRQI